MLKAAPQSSTFPTNWKRSVLIFQSKSLAEYFKTPANEGLGKASKAVIEAAEFHCANDSAFIAKLREASVTMERGGQNTKGINQHTKVEVDRHNVPVNQPVADEADEVRRGNSRAYTLQRIAAVAPEMLARIDAGEISANAAAIELGIRTPAPTPMQTIMRLLTKLSRDVNRRGTLTLDRRAILTPAFDACSASRAWSCGA